MLFITNIYVDDGLDVGPLHHHQQHGDGLWLLDMERTLALLVGRCLGWMLLGCGVSKEETDSGMWLQKCLFASGLQLNSTDIGMICDIIDICISIYITERAGKYLYITDIGIVNNRHVYIYITAIRIKYLYLMDIGVIYL